MHKGKIRGMKKFLELKSVRDSWPQDIRTRLSNPRGEGDFIQKARLTGAESYQIQGALHIISRFGDSAGRKERDLLRWVVLYLMQQSGSGHIRIGREDFFKDFPLWLKSGGVSFDLSFLTERFTALLQENSRLFGIIPSEEAPILRTEEDQSYYLLKRWRYEKRFLELLDPLVGEKGRSILPGFEDRRDLEGVFSNLKGDSSLILGEETLPAAAMVCSRLFSVITGGPGTGKTTILSGVIRLLLKVRKLKGLEPLNIRLCAPTGRAAGGWKRASKSYWQIRI